MVMAFLVTVVVLVVVSVIAPVLMLGTCHKPVIRELCGNLKPENNNKENNYFDLSTNQNQLKRF